MKASELVWGIICSRVSDGGPCDKKCEGCSECLARQALPQILALEQQAARIRELEEKQKNSDARIVQQRGELRNQFKVHACIKARNDELRAQLEAAWAIAKEDGAEVSVFPAKATSLDAMICAINDAYVKKLEAARPFVNFTATAAYWKETRDAAAQWLKEQAKENS